MILATYPYGVQVSPRQWFAGRHRFGFGHEKVYSTQPMEVLRDYAASHDIPFYDATPRFRNQNETLFYDMDGHFNARGHTVYGEGLAAFLEGVIGS